MERTVFAVLVITIACSLSEKHVFVQKKVFWKIAQLYCRSIFTDLSPITNELEEQAFRKSVSQNSYGWIGLYRENKSPTGWKWSGGDDATYQNWAQNPSTRHNYASWTSNGWLSNIEHQNYFFCLNLTVVKVEKTWEEALKHCRESHTNLSSLLSETERLLATREIQPVHITDPVWIGLRFLGDSWVWVDGNPLVYKAWPQGGDQDHRCPKQRRCAALTKKGEWENRDCQERLNFICH